MYGVDVSKEEVKLIRKALKSMCKTLSVRKGRGTAASWIDVQGSLEHGFFTEEEQKALKEFGLNGGGSNLAVISPDDRRRFVERAAEVLGVELPKVIADDYTQRDENRRKAEERAEKRRVEKIEMENQGYEQCPVCHKWFDPNDMVLREKYFSKDHDLLCQKCSKTTQLIIG